MLDQRLAAAAVILKSRIDVSRARLATLEEEQRASHDRLAAFTSRMNWIPLGLNAWARLYPIIAGALALTVLFRLRRVLLLRRSIGDQNLDVMAPSWIIGPPGAPGRWWALILVTLPVLATAHAAIAALADAALFANAVGDPNAGAMIGFGVVYTGLVLAGAWQLVAISRGLVAQPAKRGGGGREPAR
jgi:hypothetical protein